MAAAPPQAGGGAAGAAQHDAAQHDDIDAAVRRAAERELSHAALGGDLPRVKHFVRAGVDINARRAGEFGAPLVSAACNGHTDVVRFLLDAGAEIGDALHSAAIYGRFRTVKLLLSRGADARAVDESEQTPLHVTGEKSAMVDVLVGAGADVDARDAQGRTPLMTVNRAFATNELEGTVRRLLHHGARVDARSADGETALHFASDSGADLSVVRELLRAGASAASLDCRGLSPLHWACGAGMLLEDSERRRAQEAGEWNVYEHFQPSTDVVATLLDAGADPRASASADSPFPGWQPLHFLVVAICVQLEEGGWDFPEDFARKMTPTVQLLINRGADVNAATGSGDTPLMLALRQGAGGGPVVKELMTMGASSCGPPSCRACATDGKKGRRRRELQELAVGAAAEVAALRAERAAWLRERAALDAAKDRVAAS